MSISSTTRTAGPFTGNDTTTVFPFAFKVFSNADLLVVQQDTSTLVETTLVLNTDYTVSLNANQNSNPGGSVTLPSALATGLALFVTSDIDNLQTLDLTNQGGFYPEVINDAFDRIVVQNQQQQTDIDRSVKISQFDDASQLAALVSDVTRLAESIDGLDTLVGHVDNIDIVAGIDSEVTTVAGISANVTTVAGISANVTTVAGIDSEVTAVAGNATNITTVAGIDSEVTTVAGIDSEVTAVAGNATNITTVAGIDSEVTTVAGISANVTTVAGIDSEVTAVAGNATNINAVAANWENIDAVAGNETNINTVAGDAANINVVASDLLGDDDIGTVAEWIDEGGSVAAGVTYDNTVSGFVAENVQDALDEVAISSILLDSFFFRSYQMTGGNDVSVGIYTGSADATERRTLNIPPMLVNINGATYRNTSVNIKDLNTSANWDSATYATAANRAGKDFYVYACTPGSGSAPVFVLSANTTYPTGYSASTSRKVGGFHCLCLSAGSIASAPNISGYITGDIIPRSVWDLINRPVSDPEGMRYSKIGKWVDIYLPSYSGGKLVSVYGGVIADGVSSPAFHAYKFDQEFGRIGKMPIASMEFVVASLGSNQGTNISGSSDPGTTGGHYDTSGRRMIDDEGGEDMCGVMWQWGREQGGANTGASWANAYDGNDSGVAGQHYMAPLRPQFGGNWGSGVWCGSRASDWNHSPLYLGTSVSSRGAAEPRVSI